MPHFTTPLMCSIIYRHQQGFRLLAKSCLQASRQQRPLRCMLQLHGRRRQVQVHQREQSLSVLRHACSICCEALTLDAWQGQVLQRAEVRTCLRYASIALLHTHVQQSQVGQRWQSAHRSLCFSRSTLLISLPNCIFNAQS